MEKAETENLSVFVIKKRKKEKKRRFRYIKYIFSTEHVRFSAKGQERKEHTFSSQQIILLKKIDNC